MPAPRKSTKQPRSSGARPAAAPVAAGVPAVLAIGPGPVEVEVPELEGEFLDETLRLWSALWQEPHATAIVGAQKVVALRWIEAFDQWRRAMRAVVAMPVVNGSTGQPVMNPLATWVASREAEMEKCEKQLGIGLRNRSDLGIAAGQAKLTAAQLIELTKRGRDGGSNGEGIEAGGPDEDGWEAAE